jgi:F-type H+-transporting ATPase subunit gamma
MDGFVAGSFDAVYVVYAKFNSALSHPAHHPPAPPRAGAGRHRPRRRGGLRAGARRDEILGRILPLYVRNGVYRALVETTAGFYGAQRTAMKNATDNAGDMLNALTRTYNRVRQAAITQEIAEIVGGAAALE